MISSNNIINILMWSALRLRNLKRYFLASIINTIIGIFAIILFYKLTNQRYLTIFICSFIGYAYSIMTYYLIAFPGKLSKPPYIKYGITYCSSFFLNGLLTRLAINFTDNFLIIQLFVIPLVVFIQWLASNLWVFKSKR